MEAFPKEKVDRINELARLSKERELTEEEREEQHKLRQEFLDYVRKDMIEKLGPKK